MSNPDRLIRLEFVDHETHKMTSSNSSILKGANWRDARRVPAPRPWLGYAAVVIAKLKVLAPYAAIELVLPGGSVIAIALWLYRRRNNGVGIGQLQAKLVSFLRFADPLRSNAAVCAAGSDGARG
jgi:hypothetical protein